MPGKIARSTPRPPFGPPVARVAARSSSLAFREARKSLRFTPVRESYGECRFIRWPIKSGASICALMAVVGSSMSWKSVVKDLTPPLLMRAIRPPKEASTYISASQTIAAAKAANLSVRDHVERLWGSQGRPTFIINRLPNSSARNIVEIGPGTGRYTEEALRRYRPTRYQIYETAKDWAAWLAESYPVEVCEADGRSLSSTPSQSCDLIHAHGVFVCLPLLIAHRYLEEMVRVASPNACIAFDVISEKCISPEVMKDWVNADVYWPTLLLSDYLIRTLSGFRLVDRFLMPYAHGVCEYFIFRRQDL
jgi:methyltransferase family protein